MARKGTCSGNVKLREKKLSNGDRSLYLDIYHHGKRTYDYLKLYLTGDKAQDAETRRIAETIRSRREIELQASEHGIMPAHVRQANFVDYFKVIADEKNHSSWNATYLQLEEYTGGASPSLPSPPIWWKGSGTGCWGRYTPTPLISTSRSSNPASTAPCGRGSW